MTTDPPPSANSPNPQTDTPPRPSLARRLGWPLLLLVLIAAAIALVAHAWNISRAQRDEAARNQQRMSLLERQLGSLHSELAAAANRVQHAETAAQALREDVDALHRRTTQMEDTPPTPPPAADLGEINAAISTLRLDQAELLLMLAGQRAQHDGDLTGARALTAQADAILARLPAADFAELRQTLAAELDTLATWSERTRTAATANNQKATRPPAPPPPSWWQRALAGWISIHPTPAPAPPPAELAPPTTADSPALGKTLQQLRQRRAE